MQADSDPPTYTQMIYLLIGQLLNINFIVIESSVDDDDNNNDNANNVFQSREQFWMHNEAHDSNKLVCVCVMSVSW